MYLACEFSQGLAVTGTGSCIHILNCVCVRVAEVSLIASGQHFLWDPQEFPGRLRDMFWVFLQAPSQFNVTCLLTHPLKRVLSYIFQQLKPEISRKGSCLSRCLHPPPSSRSCCLLGQESLQGWRLQFQGSSNIICSPSWGRSGASNMPVVIWRKIIGQETKLFVASPRIFSDYRCISSVPCVIFFLQGHFWHLTRSISTVSDVQRGHISPAATHH